MHIKCKHFKLVVNTTVGCYMKIKGGGNGGGTVTDIACLLLLSIINDFIFKASRQSYRKLMLY